MSSAIPKTTKAFAFPQKITEDTGPQGLYPVEIPTPEPGPDDVLVKVHAVSLNYRDIMVCRAMYPNVVAKASEKDGPIPTSDAAGEVVAVGASVKDLKVGDRVTTLFSPTWQSGGFKPDYGTSAWGAAINGTLAQYIVNKPNAFVPFPTSLSYQEASTLPCAALTAYHALFAPTSGREHSLLKEEFAGKTVLVQGSGGVSIFGAQLAAAMGAGRIFVTSSSDEKLAKYRKIVPGLKEEDCVNYKTFPKWGEEVLKRTNGAGVEHIIEIGGSNTLNNSLKAAAPSGYLHIIGIRGGGASEAEAKELTADLPLTCILKAVQLRGVFVGSRKMHEELVKLVESASIKPVIDKVFEFKDSLKALEHIESGNQFGKIIINIDH